MNKHIITLIISVFAVSFIVSAQQQIVVDSPEYQRAKMDGTLEQYSLVLPETFVIEPGSYDLSEPLNHNNSSSQLKKHANSGQAKSNDCDCYQVPDNTYSVLSHCDDACSATINLPFAFSFYGSTYTTIYINNNGNITFDSTMTTYSSNEFFSRKVISPFWADVHTGTNSNPIGDVKYKVVGNATEGYALYVNWHNVGYYNSGSAGADKRNSFQLIISDGNHPSIPDGNNVAFCYQQMQWTTGTASCSGGLGSSCTYFGNTYSCGTNGGFCGIPATAGVSKGTGQNGPHFLVGYFDHPGNDFDGIGGNNDGVGYLSDKSWFFKTLDAFNIAPVAQGVSACDTFHICTYNDTADVKIEFLAPEADQTTTITYNDGNISQYGGFEELLYSPGPAGGTAILHLRVIGTSNNIGVYNMSITATDSYEPPASTTIPFVVVIENIGSTLDPQINYTMACNEFEISVSDGGSVQYEDYLWDDLTTYPSTTITESGIYGVTVYGNSCHKRVEQHIHVPKPEPFNLKGNLYLCPGEDSTLITVGNAPNLGTITWGPPSPSSIVNDSSAYYQASSGAITYKIYNTDTTDLCTNDTTFTIHMGTPSSIFLDTIICNNLNFQVTGATLGSTATWSSPNPEISFSNIYANNPVITASKYGIYTVSVPNPCNETLHAEIIYSGKPVLFPEDTTCGTEYIVDPPIATLGGKWTTSSPSIISFSNDTIPNPTISAAFAPTEAIVTYTDKYCPMPFSSVKIHFVDVKPQVPPFACDLTTSDLDSKSYGTGTWAVVNNPNTPFNEAEQATFSPSATDNQPTLTVTQPGVYTIQYTDDFCNKISEHQVYFHPTLFQVLADTALCAGQEHTLSALQNDMPTSYLWSNGQTTASITTTQGGEHTVKISNDCYSIIDTAYIEQLMCDINAPNVLSLTSNTGNNTWKLLESEGILNYHCLIVNRWGELMFETNDIHEGWKGTDKKGNTATEGVYFYTIKATAIGNMEIEKQGFITLIK